MNIRPRNWKIFNSAGRFFSTVAAVLIVLAVVVGGAWCTCIGFGTGDAGRKALEKAGYEDIDMGMPSRYQCSEKDSFSNTFTATNPRGDRVEGVVCCGMSAGCMGKACTIRF